MNLPDSKSKNSLAKIQPSERIPIFAAMNAAVEIFVGSILHGFRVPFGGNFLSLVQAGFLTLATRTASTRMQAVKLPFYISSISSCLKSLSPAGNKLGPMLSIWMQGTLFSISVMLFGRNPVGTAVGAALLSLWAFVQPILTLYLFFGNSLLDAGAFYFEKVQSKLGVGGEQLVYAFSAIVLIKLLLAVLIGGILVPLNEKRLLGFSFSKFEKHRSEIRNKIMQRQSTDGGHSIFLLALKDLFQPLFFFSFFLGVVFVVFSTSDHAKIIWLALRPIAVAYLFFVFCRSSFFRELPKKLGRFTFFERFAHFFDQTLGILLIDSKLDKVEKSEPN